ncbi:MAG: carboxymuconolactone decarboxylase family protein [Bacilli bacterium]|nr:carboxymuconolactone decarboxylase family protein [Bacilli bacterium]
MKYNEPRYFSAKTFNHTILEATYMMVKHHKELGLINKKFRSNIMLAVTYVNGCKLCSYYHTNVLIKSGASEEELKSMLDGSFKELESNETKALLFAEHYADVNGLYDPETFDALIKYYGKEIAIGILASIKLIMFGNMNGISWGNLWQWIRFRKPPNAKFWNDLYIAISPVFLMPAGILINLFRKKKPI